MDNIVIKRTVPLDEMLRPEPLHGMTFTQESGAHTFEITCTRGGQAVTLTGNCTAYFLRTDNTTVTLGNKAQAGDVRKTYARIENGKAVVTLHSDCYNVPGRFKLSIFNDIGTESMCVYVGVGVVERTVSGTMIDSGAAIPTLNQLQNAVTNVNTAIANAEAATTAAEKVNITQTKSGNVITVTTTNRNNVKTNKTITEPTAVVSKDENGPYRLTVKDANGTTGYEIPDPAAEVKKKANLDAVTVKKTVGPAEMVSFEDGVDAPAVLAKIKLETKQDLHGYDHPWVGGAGKNKLGISGTWDANGNPVNANNGIRTELLDVVPGQICTAYKDTPITGGMYNMMARKFDASGTFIGSSQLLGYDAVGFVQWTVPTDVYKIGVVQFIDPSMDMSTIKLMFATEVVTSYEPYSNICPIEGYDTVKVTATGKNLYNKKDYLDAFINTSSALIVSNANAVTVFMECQPNTTYTLSKFVGTRFSFGETSVKPTAGAAVSNIKSTGSAASLAITTTSSAKYVVAFVWLSTTDSVTKTEALDSIQIELGDVATGYEPFGNSTSLSVAQAAGATVYGGTVTLNEDGSGTLVVDRAFKQPAATDIVNSSSVLAGRYLTGGQYITNRAANTKVMCNAYTGYERDNSVNKGTVYFSNSNQLVFNTSFATLSDFQSWINDNELYVVYYLATPSNPIQLTATQVQTLVGTNHVWTDAGEITLTYRSDKYAELERRLSQLEALVLES